MSSKKTNKQTNKKQAKTGDYEGEYGLLQQWYMSVAQQENSGLSERCQLSEGRLARLEKVLAELQAKITDLKSRSIRNNLRLVFYNIEQMQEKKQAEQTLKRLLNSMKQKMKVDNPNDLKI